MDKELNNGENDKKIYSDLEEDMLDIVSTPGYIPRAHGTWTYAELKCRVFESFVTKAPLLILGADSGGGKCDTVRLFSEQIATFSTKGKLLEENNFCCATCEFERPIGTENTPREFIDWSEIDDAKKHEVINNPSNYFVFRKFISNEMERSDIRGNPTPTGEGYYTHKLNLNLSICVAENIEGIIFIDNYGLGSEEVNVGLRRLVNRKVGDDRLSPGFLIILASDFPDNDTNPPLDINPLSKVIKGVFAPEEHCHLEKELDIHLNELNLMTKNTPLWLLYFNNLTPMFVCRSFTILCNPQGLLDFLELLKKSFLSISSQCPKEWDDSCEDAVNSLNVAIAALNEIIRLYHEISYEDFSNRISGFMRNIFPDWDQQEVDAIELDRVAFVDHNEDPH
jgi:hypothetical protein